MQYIGTGLFIKDNSIRSCLYFELKKEFSLRMMKTFDLLSATINSLILSVILIILIEMIGVFLNISLFLSTSLSSSYTTIYPFSNPAIKVIVLLFIFCFTSKHSTGDSNFLEFSRFNIYFCSLNPYFLIFPNDDPVYMISFSFLFF